MKRYIYSFIILSLLVSCFSGIHEKNNISDQTSFTVSEKFLTILDKYIKSHPKYKSLTVITDFEYNWRKGYKSNNIILIGPSLDRLFEKDRIYPSRIIKRNGKTIFIQSSLDCLYEQNKLGATYHRHSVKSAKSRDDLILYIKSAYAVNFSNNSTFKLISKDASSLLLRKRVEFIPPEVDIH